MKACGRSRADGLADVQMPTCCWPSMRLIRKPERNSLEGQNAIPECYQKEMQIATDAPSTGML